VAYYGKSKKPQQEEKMKRFAAALTLVIFASIAGAQTAKEVAITIYNNNLGLVKDIRRLDIKKGTAALDFSEVASQIDATSVNFRCLDDANVQVLEQNYLYDLVSSEALLKRYLGKNIEAVGKDGKNYRGQLMSYDSQNLILNNADGEVTVIALDKIADYKFPSLPEGLLLKPTLRWMLDSPSAGAKKCEVSYLTNGISWQSDYVAVVSADDSQLDLSGWVTISNSSGTSYDNAALKLVAGDVHQVTPPAPMGGIYRDNLSYEAKAAAPQFQEEGFFEYHLYTLSRPATINDKEIKQLSLFPSTRTKARKIFIFDATGGGYYYNNNQDKIKIKANLEFENSEKAGLGMPLPKGKLRVYKADTKGALQFAGEDLIDHTPKDEKVRVYLGDAFDITGSRKVINHENIDPSGNHYRETYEINLKNHKKENIVVTVVEHTIGWREWLIKKSSLEYNKVDNYKVEYEVSVPANGESTLTYTIEYY
jgi:hypothetical protein